MPDYLPTNELELQMWLANFEAVADTNATALGISAADTMTLKTDVNSYANTLSAAETKRTAYDSAVTAKEMQRRQTVEFVRGLVKSIQANKTVSDILKSNLGITVPSGARTKTAPVTPFDLMAKPFVSGVNEISWDKAGNKPTTQYLVECKPATGGDWQFVGQTTASKFQHLGQTPGRAQLYRVIAERSRMSSQPSEVVGVYGG